MALSERFDKRSRINVAEVAYSGEPDRADQNGWRRSRTGSHLGATYGNTYHTDTEEASSACFSSLFTSSETVE